MATFPETLNVAVSRRRDAAELESCPNLDSLHFSP